jgi:hypothetical protein
MDSFPALDLMVPAATTRATRCFNMPYSRMIISAQVDLFGTMRI